MGYFQRKRFCYKAGNTVRFLAYVLVEALGYKPESCRLNSGWCNWNFFIDILSFRPHYGSGVASASNRNEYQEF